MPNEDQLSYLRRLATVGNDWGIVAKVLLELCGETPPSTEPAQPEDDES